MITIPDTVLQAAIAEAVKEQVQGMDLDSVTLLDVHAASKLMGMSTQAFRRVKIESVMVGTQKTRWSLKAIKDYIASRTVKVCK